MNSDFFNKNEIIIKNQINWIPLSELHEISKELHNTPCGGTGVCGKCRVMVTGGEVTPVTDEERKWLSNEELNNGIRLACYCRMKGDIRIRIYSKHEMQILAAVSESSESASLPVKNKSLIMQYGSSKQKSGIYGMAVDIGTTSVVGALFDLDAKIKISSTSRLNPQCFSGFDLLSRIYYSSKNNGLAELNTLILDCIDEIITSNCNHAGITENQITNIIVTGNNVMLHILAGVDPSSMGRSPYNPVFTSGFQLSASALGLKKPNNAVVSFPPSASAFIGADIITGIIATSLDLNEDNTLLIDMGTNGEMVLYSGSILTGCSVAMGPALEGMNIECGMRAENGAIDRIWIEDEKINIHTIGEFKPSGICGSGIIDAVRVLLKKQIITASGKMLHEVKNDKSNKLLSETTPAYYGRKFYFSSPDTNYTGIYISQNDIRNLQLAKSAVCSGITLLLEEAGIKTSDVNKIYLAGALGNFGDTESLIETGFFPELWRDRIFKSGNSALDGTAIMLLSKTARVKAENIARSIKCLDLATHTDFQDVFVRTMSFNQSAWRDVS